jgi:F-type H+-transporting ATPase subunit epsilon
MRVIKGQERDLYFVAGGFAEVNQSSVIVLAEEYEKADTIDVDAAKKAKKHAEDLLAEKKEGTDIPAAQHALARAEARLRVVEEAKPLKK